MPALIETETSLRAEVDVDLGDGGGVVRHELTPVFSASELLTLRFPLPIELEMEPVQGVRGGLRRGIRKSACPQLRRSTVRAAARFLYRGG